MGGGGFGFVLVVYGLASLAAVFVAGTLSLGLGIYVHQFAKEDAPLRSCVSGCAIMLGSLMVLAVLGLLFRVFHGGA